MNSLSTRSKDFGITGIAAQPSYPPGTFRILNPATAAITDLVGPRPRPTTIAYNRWKRDFRDAIDAWCPSEQGTVYYYSAAGNDTNDGRDGLGFNLSGASWVSSTKTLTKTSGFSSYEWMPGDRIYISGGTGATTGLYFVASKTDANNIVLTASFGPDASDVTSSNGPRKTVAKAQDTIDNASTATTHLWKMDDVYRNYPPIVAVGSSTTNTITFVTANLTNNSIVRTMAVGQFIVIIDSSGVQQTTYITASAPSGGNTVITTNDNLAIIPAYVGPSALFDFHNKPVTLGMYGVGKRPPIFSTFELINSYPWSNPSGDKRRWSVVRNPNAPSGNLGGDTATSLRRSGLWAAMKNQGATDDVMVRVDTDGDMFGQQETYTLSSSGLITAGTFSLAGGFFETLTTATVDPSTFASSPAALVTLLETIFPVGSFAVTGTTLLLGYTITATGQISLTNLQVDLSTPTNSPTGGTITLTKTQDGIYPVPLDSGSWRYTTGTNTLTMMQPYHAQSMNGTAYMEVCAQNSYAGFYAMVDKCRVQGVRFEGFGCGQYDFSNHRYTGGTNTTTGLTRDEAGVSCNAVLGAGKAFVLADCEIYYGGRHTFVATGPCTTLVIRNKHANLGRDGVLCTGYSGGGGQATVFWDNIWGTASIPSKSGAQASNPWGYFYGDSGSGTDAHTDNSGSTFVGFFLDFGSTYLTGPWQSFPSTPANITVWNNGWTGTDPINCTSFIDNLKCQVRNPLAKDTQAPPSGTGTIFGRSNFGQTLLMNSEITCAILGQTTPGLDIGFWVISGTAGSGVGWNNTRRFVATRGVPRGKSAATFGISTVSSGGSVTWGWHEYFSRIELIDELGFNGTSGICGRLVWAVNNGAGYSTALPSDLRLFNNIIINNTTEEVGSGTGAQYIAINDNQTGGQTTAQSNAYFGGQITGTAATDAYLSFTADAYAVKLKGQALHVSPALNDPTVVPVAQLMKLWGTWTLEYDSKERARGTTVSALGTDEYR